VMLASGNGIDAERDASNVVVGCVRGLCSVGNLFIVLLRR